MVKKLICTLMTTAAVSVANAQTYDIATIGSWKAFGGRSEDGKLMCGISVADSKTGRWFGIKWFKGDNYLVFHAIKSSWHIPPETQMTIRVQFDNSQPYIGNGMGMNTMVQATVPYGIVKEFITEFRSASKMYISFPDGNESPWTADMTGSNGIANIMAECVGKLEGRATQPFAPKSPPPTQPYGTTPTPVPTPTVRPERI